MKIERINENKIKVTVSIEDLIARNIEVESLNYHSRETQELFWDMMKKAEIEFGFSTSDAQLCVEASPNSIEGFVIVITRIDGSTGNVDEALESIQKYIRNKYKKSDFRSKRRPKKIPSLKAIYQFSKIEDLKSLCSVLKDQYSGCSTLFKYKNNYFLSIFKSGCSKFSVADLIIQEYGSRVLFSNSFEGYLEEYGKKICDQDVFDIVLNYY